MYPDFLYRGTWRPTMLATSKNGSVAAVPAGGGAYMEGVPARQRLSAFFLKQLANRPENRELWYDDT